VTTFAAHYTTVLTSADADLKGSMAMTTSWSAAELERIDAAEELRITTERPDGTFRPDVPIWVVSAGGHVYVRTWYRRDNGWFGRAVASRRAHVQVAGLAADVTVEDVGDADQGLRASVDAAYRAKYGHYGAATVDQMVSDAAAATTLRLTPNSNPLSRTVRG
jgi:hypothetical protein